MKKRGKDALMRVQWRRPSTEAACAEGNGARTRCLASSGVGPLLRLLVLNATGQGRAASRPVASALY
jgi:hypothetical protein